MDAKTEADLKRRFKELVHNGSSEYELMMLAAHKYYNKKFFKGKLKPAVLLAAVPPKVNIDEQMPAGCWVPKRRCLYLIPMVFKHTFDYFRTLMLHEMCHQAQTDIDKMVLIHPPTQSHNELWVNWMRLCGLAPALESLTYDIIPDGITKSRRANYMRSINKINKVSSGKIHPDAMKFGQMLTFFDEDDNGTLVKAMYVTRAYHPEAHENMIVVVGEYHEPKHFDYHWPEQPMWLIDEQPSPELKKAGKSIIKKLGPK